MATPQPEFVTYCLDLLDTLGPCVARRMFGGWGISRDGLTFGLITDLGDGERLWLKTDATSRDAFVAAGCPQFTYQSRGKTVGLHYHAVPDRALESPAQMHDWAQLAWGTALRAHSRALSRASAPKKPAARARARPSKRTRP